MKPLVSVVLPVYNRARYVGRAIESVLEQSYEEFELVIIDDGSTDETLAIVEEHCARDGRIRFMQDRNHKGVVKRLNEAIDASKGVYIARLDDDDFWCDKQKLEKQVRFLEGHSKYVLVGGGQVRISPQNVVLARYLPPQDDEEVRKEILTANPYTSSSVVFTKAACEEVGGYDESLSSSEDWDLWMKLGRMGKLYNFQEYFVYYLEGDQNRSNAHLTRDAFVDMKLRMRHRKYFPGFLKAFLFGCLAVVYVSLPLRSHRHHFFV